METWMKYPNMKRPLYMVIGESGSGKTTIVHEVSKILRVRRAITCTTRKPRLHEVGTYNFMSRELFDTKLANGEMLAVTRYCGNYYGVTKTELDVSDILIVEPDGYRDIIEHYDVTRPRFTIQVDTSEWNRKHRMREMGRSTEDIDARIAEDAARFRLVPSIQGFHFHVSNNFTLRHSVSAVADIILAYWPIWESCYPDEMRPEAQENGG